MKRFFGYGIAAVTTFFFFLLATGSWAAIPLDGYLIAEKPCPAYHSIKKKTNPGNILLQKGFAYVVTAKNKPDGTYYQVKVENNGVSQRWVETSCGTLLVDCKSSGGVSETGGQVSREYLLAISWQPGFCQTHQYKTECETQTKDRYDATHLSLHGLWPQPKENAYCGVGNTNKAIDRNKHWNLLPALEVADTTRADMAVVMPGIASYLDRHEWIKHGTCYGASADEYYREAIMLVDQINDSAVGNLFTENVGQVISSNEIRKTFDEAFGAGSGNKVNVKCKGNLITELWINLRGEIEPDTSIGDLLHNAAPTSSTCTRGKIDPAGF